MKNKIHSFFSSFLSFLFRRGKAPRVAPSRLLSALLSRSIIAVGVLAAGKAAAVEGGTVVQGSATINQSGPQTTITQGSNRAIINWNNFDIGKQESVTFKQPDANAAVLNRVTSPNATMISGALNANGRVFIVNPSGVVFGSGASVDVGGMVASTLGINDANFMAGQLNFAGGGNPAGRVWVQPGADITAQSFVAMLGNSVVNEGSVTAGKNPNAQNRGIAMVAADAATIQLGNWSVQIDQAAKDALVRNAGSLVIGQSQSDGSIQLNAAGRNALMGVLLTNTGTISNQSEGAGSTTTLQSTGGVADKAGDAVGHIEAAAGKVEIRGSTISLDGDVTIGTDATTTPVFVEIGGAGTTQVTQGLMSTISAKSKLDAQINMAAQKVLALSGELLAPGGTISLASTIVDDGLLIPVADKVNVSGVETWTKLPLVTGDGQAVYLGKDWALYSADGRRLDGATHLYDEANPTRDVGTVADMNEAKSEGKYFDESKNKTLASVLNLEKRFFTIPIEGIFI